MSPSPSRRVGGPVWKPGDPTYWGGPFGGTGAPAVSEVEFPNIDTPSDALTALENNSLDWAGNEIAGLSAFTSGAGHKTWFAGVNTVTLYPDLNAFPFNILAVRKAVSLAIDRHDLSVTGEYGTEPPATNASGLTLPACGHLPPIERPDALRAALEIFLGEELLPRDPLS